MPSYLESKVGGRWILSITESRGLYRDSLGFAQANTEVLAFNEAIIPAFAIDTVCCSITCLHPEKEKILYIFRRVNC